MTPAMFEALMRELCKTSNRAALHNKGLELIRDALGDNAHEYVKGVSLFVDRVRQLGKPVVPRKFVGRIETDHTPL